MLIQIESVAKDGPRKVSVTPDDGEPFKFTATNLADAHKTLKAGRKDGWDTIRPASGKLAGIDTKIAESVKADAEPKPAKAPRPAKPKK